MKKLITLTLSFFTATLSFSQFGECSSVSGYDVSVNYPEGILNATPNFTIVATDNYAGEYFFCNVIQGKTYVWTTCPTFGGACSYDSQLTLIDQNGNFLCSSDDYCNSNASLQWTATYTGIVDVNLTEFDGLSNTTNTQIVWKYNSSVGLENEFKESIKFYPTVVEDNLKYSANYQMDGKLEVIDLTGKTILEINLTENSGAIDMTKFSSGQYILKFTDESNLQFTQKIIKK